MQYTSKTPPSRGDLAQLHEALDKRLVQRQANERGLLLLRIRDESRMTIDAYKTCVWSGRVGGAAVYTMRARRPNAETFTLNRRGTHGLLPTPSLIFPYAARCTSRLYDSSVTFGVRKQLQAEQGIPEREAEVLAVAEQKKALEAKMLSLRSKLENAERRIAAKRTLDEKRRKEELGYLKHEGKHLEAFVKNMGRS